MPHHHQHRHGSHTHGVMSGWIVGPYDVFIGGLLMRPTYGRIATAVASGLPDDARITDVGTGPGRLVVALARRHPRMTITGIDPSADMLRKARQRARDLPNAHLVEASSESLPAESGSQHAVVSSLSSHHWSDPAGALSEQARVLVPGGRLWLFDLISHLDPAISDQISAAGLTLVDEDPDLGWAARRIRTFTAVKSELARFHAQLGRYRFPTNGEFHGISDAGAHRSPTNGENATDVLHHPARRKASNRAASRSRSGRSGRRTGRVILLPCIAWSPCSNIGPSVASRRS